MRELAMTLLQFLNFLLMISIVLSVFSLAMRARAHDLAYLFTHWRLGLGAVVAMYVIVPGAAIAMCLLFTFRPPVEIALVAFAFAPMPPVLPGTQLKAGGRPSYVAGLMVLTTAVAIIAAPIGVAVAGRAFGIDVGVAPERVAMLVGVTVAAPLMAGLAVAWLAGDHTQRIAAGTGVLGHGLLVIAMIGIFVLLAPAIWAVLGDGTLLALALLTGIGFAAGYLLGGPDLHDKAALSLASATRHPGVAIAIATANFPDEKLAPAAVALALLTSTLLGLPYVRLLAMPQPKAPLGPQSA
jgi:bile acid:Na+ symporter, BASS family